MLHLTPVDMYVIYVFRIKICHMFVPKNSCLEDSMRMFHVVVMVLDTVVRA